MSGPGREWSKSQDRGSRRHPFDKQKTHQQSSNDPTRGGCVFSSGNHDSVHSSSTNTSLGSFAKTSGKPRPFTMTKVENQATKPNMQCPAPETHVVTKSGAFNCMEIPINVEEENQSDPNVTKNMSESGENKSESMSIISKDSPWFTEVVDDLFTARDNVSLVHCVGADFTMGSGIAVKFREKFGSVGKLLDQNIGPGGVAFIRHRQKHVFYLVTKQASKDKPTNEMMRKSLVALHDECKKLKVTELAMPQIGCGLDGLLWNDVKEMLLEIFADGFTITVYNLEMDSVCRPKPASKRRVVNQKMILNNIEPETGLLYIGCADMSVSYEMKSLDEKHQFLSRLRNQRIPALTLGSAFYTHVRSETIFGLICKESANSPLSYNYLEAALEHLKKLNKKFGFGYYAIQAFEQKDDPYVMEKIDTLLRNSLIDAEFWICWPPSLDHKYPSKSERVHKKMDVEQNHHLSGTDQQPSLSKSNFSKKCKEVKNTDNQDRRATEEVAKKVTAQLVSDSVEESWETYVDLPLPVPENDAPYMSENDSSMENQSAQISAKVGGGQGDSSWDNSECEVNQDDATNVEDHAAAEKRKSREKKEANQLMKQKEKRDSRSPRKSSCIIEHKGDLFEADNSISLVHCVGADFRMGSGIAVMFRQKFRSVGELLDQRVNQGGVAVIEYEGRHIFYLVTKRESTGKPTYETMERSLHALHAKCKQLNVTKLAMPRIGCGLDRLSWDKVRPMIERIFSDGFTIQVYSIEKPICDSRLSSGGGRKSWDDTTPSNYEQDVSARILRDMQHRLDSMSSKLREMHDEQTIDSADKKTDRVMNDLLSEISKLLEMMENLSTRMNNWESLRVSERFENFEQKFVAQEAENRNLKDIIANMEHRLQEQETASRVPNFPHVSSQPRRSHESNGVHPRSGYSEAPAPLVPNFSPAQVYTDLGMYCQSGSSPCWLMNNEIHKTYRFPSSGRYMNPNSAIYATDTLQAEWDALLRATRDVARPHGYRVEASNGNILVRKDDRSQPIIINSYNDLKTLENS